MSSLEVRPARSEDRDSILAFCTNTWDWGDYIDRVWDEWLHNPNGRLFVATVDGQPVGVAHIRMLTPIDAWLEGLRVDPQFRHQGIAKALNDAILLEAMRRGAKYARLIIDSTNSRSIQITENSFFRRVGSFMLFSSPPLPPSEQVQERTQLAGASDLDEIIDYLNVSNIFPLMGGLYNVGFTARPISSELLAEKIAAQQIYVLRRWDRLDGLAIAEPYQGHQGMQLSIGYIDGTAIEPISLVAYDLRRRLSELGLGSARVYAPELIIMRDGLGGVGYEWDGSIFYTYERGLT